MEPITYLLGLPPTIYIFLSKFIECKFSLINWITSYKSSSTYVSAKEKYSEFLKKENEQKNKIESMKES